MDAILLKLTHTEGQAHHRAALVDLTHLFGSAGRSHVGSEPIVSVAELVIELATHLGDDDVVDTGRCCVFGVGTAGDGPPASADPLLS